MKPSIVTKGIVLRRLNYAEADRILTFLTPDQGKVTAIAKGVRKSKSKLAGGIELFSISDISYIPGRREIGTLISARLEKHYDNIVKETTRTNIGFECIKTINKATEEAAESGYFDILRCAFEGLDDLELQPEITSVWFSMQLLKLAGHAPNLQTDLLGKKLDASKTYNFYFDDMKFGEGNGEGKFTAHIIKFLRLGLQAKNPLVLGRVAGVEELTAASQPLVISMLRNYVRI
jgi:DNA repair protein RecO (recombination protein O)